MIESTSIIIRHYYPTFQSPDEYRAAADIAIRAACHRLDGANEARSRAMLAASGQTMPGGRGEHNACRRQQDNRHIPNGREFGASVRNPTNNAKGQNPASAFPRQSALSPAFPMLAPPSALVSRRERPMGRLITPVGGGSPYTKARYSRPISRFLNFSTRRFLRQRIFSHRQKAAGVFVQSVHNTGAHHFNGGRVMIQQRRLQSPHMFPRPG